MWEECEKRVCSPSHHSIQYKGFLLLDQEHRGLGGDGAALYGGCLTCNGKMEVLNFYLDFFFFNLSAF